MFRQMLMGGASRAAYAPEDDDGFELDDPDLGGVEDDADEPDLEDDDERLIADAEGDEPDDQEDPAPKPASRGANRVAAATRAAAEAKAEAAELRREMAAIRAERTGAATSENERQRAERLASMSEGDRLDYLRREGETRLEQRMNLLAFQTADANDKADYRALCVTHPVAAKMADEVEALVQKQRAAGMNVERAVAFKFLLGEKALARAGRASGKGRRTEAAGRERQQVKPGSGRGDVPQSSARGKSDAAQRRARLENVEL